MEGGKMQTPVICAVARTPVGCYRGALRNYSATELGSMTVEHLLESLDISPDSGIIDELLFGQVLQAGAGQAPARQVAIRAGLPFSTPCTTINKVCGSSLKAAMIAASAIRAGEYEVVVAGGMESMTNAPLFARITGKNEYGEMKNVMIHDGLWDIYNDEHMGITGETVARDFDISREDSDSFSARSHRLAAQAWESGWLEWEAFPIEGVNREGEEMILVHDEGIRRTTNVEKLSELQPVFSTDGQITAGNASQLSDGASAVLMASRARAEAEGWPILATIVDQTTSGLESAKVMAAPIPAISTLLERNNLTIDDLDIIEHNEAFAAASCAIAKNFEIPDEKFNPHGGAVAIGHPLGATGTRCLMTLINALRRTGGKKGIVTLCLGGGNAVAMLIESE
ncbi:MAG TPA: thiolase family protein [Candidatus Poseidoniales archaeon]|nr:MAG TPA: thiolase family protein [Candidatus Poseidoniales archaeon]